jgi:NADP-dependent 3-hydroxy acid dehydrogenase YdfG
VKKVVIVTGTSIGPGKAFGRAALEVGFSVVGTVRKSEAVHEFEPTGA